MFLVLNSSYSYLILVLAAVGFTWRVKIVTVSLLKVLKCFITTLLAIIFLSTVVRVLGNFQFFLRVLVYIYIVYILL